MLHLKFSLNFGNLKFRIPLTFGIKKLQSLEFKIWARFPKFEIEYCEFQKFVSESQNSEFQILRFIDL